jgi:4-hydroxybenzoyl-CoA thioesterase
MAHDYKLRVAFGDTDAAGIVFYPNFYRWMDAASHEFFDFAGLSPHALMEEEKRGFPLLETHCNYFAPLKYHDYVTVRTEVEEIKSKTVKVAHGFYRGEELVASGHEIRIWVSFDNGSLTSHPIPEEIHKKLKAHLKENDSVERR